FHEVGAMDSIADFVVFALLVDHLGIATMSCSRVPVGAGTVRTQHGILPLPAPATARLLEGFETVAVPARIETVTPTGAAIVATLCRDDSRPAHATITGTGTGLGTATVPDRPNALRVLRLEPVEPGPPGRSDHAGGGAGEEARVVSVLECSIDDLDPRVYGRVTDLLLGAGALDVFTTPIQMKKQRPGTLLTVLARPADEAELTRIVLTETSTLGVRHRTESRTVLDRRVVTVDTPWGEVEVKLGLLDDVVVNASPEYDECLVLAAEAGVPVKTVLATAHAAALEHLSPADRGSDSAGAQQ
ncbi:MAG TPA: LarC family nickel insertion protein, partial [Acidimicrobiales bacterium]|nr:LarC family nickel insertion protein [Acidimicrobiales bacterium]